MPGNRDPDWRGIAAALLALAVLAVLVIAAIFGGLNEYRTVSSEEVATVSTVLGAAIGAVATYLGTNRRNRPPAAPGLAEADDDEQPGITTPPPGPTPQNRSKSPDPPEPL